MGEKMIPVVYRDYPEVPYLSPDRDVEAWERTPEKFPYGVVARTQMKRLPEGLLPGHIIMLWRVHFGTFTTNSFFPRYFEYRYGVDGREVLNTLTEKGYIRLSSARESADLLSVPFLKRLLVAHGLPTSGKKAELLEQYRKLSDKEIEGEFDERRYVITPEGSTVLARYDNIIQRHGPKNL